MDALNPRDTSDETTIDKVVYDKELMVPADEILTPLSAYRRALWKGESTATAVAGAIEVRRVIHNTIILVHVLPLPCDEEPAPTYTKRRFRTRLRGGLKEGQLTSVRVSRPISKPAPWKTVLPYDGEDHPYLDASELIED